MKRFLLVLFYFILCLPSFAQRLVPFMFPGEEFTTSGITQPNFAVLDALVFQDTLFLISNNYSSSNGSPLLFMKQGNLGFQNMGATVQLPNTMFQGISEYNNQLVVLGRDANLNGVIYVHEQTGWNAYHDASVNQFQKGIEFNGSLFLFDHLKARVFQNGTFSNAPFDSVCSAQVFQGNLYFTRGNFGSDLFYLDAANTIHSVPGVCDKIRSIHVVNNQLFLSGNCSDKSFRLDPVLGVVPDNFGVAPEAVSNFLTYQLIYSPYGNFAVEANGSDLPFQGVTSHETVNSNPNIYEVLRMTDLIQFENEWWAFGETPFNCPFQGVFRVRPGSVQGSLANDHIWANFYPSWGNVYGANYNHGSIGMDGVKAVYNCTPIVNGISGSDTLGIDAVYSTSKLGFVSGPSAMHYSNEFLDRYYRVWKITQSEIDYHAAHWWEASYSAPIDLLEWPGNGEVSNGEPAILAPFHDLNGNAIYEPQQGETPMIKGDQAVFYLVNDGKDQCAVDYGVFNGETQVDLSSLVYLYNSGATPVGISNTVFQDLRFLPRGDVSLHDAYFGLHADFDVGTATDDFIGSDSLRSLMFAYNGDAFDEPSADTDGFGTFPPAVGVRFLSTLSSSTSYIVDAAGQIPITEQHFYNYQQGLTRSGNSVVNPFTNTQSHYAFPGEVGVPGVWNEDNAGNPPGDRRMLMSSYVGDINHLSPKCYTLAYTVAVDSTSAGDSNHNSVALMKQYSDVAQNYYDQYLQNESCDQLVGVEEVSQEMFGVHVYPNPTKDRFTVQTTGSNMAKIELFNVVGSLVYSQGGMQTANTQVEVSAFTPGLYSVRIYLHDGTTEVRKVMLQ